MLSQIPGPVLGLAFLFTTLPVSNVNMIGSVIFVLVIPYLGVGRTLLYLDLAARHERGRVGANAVITPVPAARACPVSG